MFPVAQNVGINIATEARRQLDAKISSRHLYVDSRTAPTARRNADIHFANRHGGSKETAQQGQRSVGLRRCEDYRAFDSTQSNRTAAGVDLQISRDGNR